MSKDKGFTLIELMIVAVIIGILVALALPHLVQMQDRARESAVRANAHSLQLAVELYAARNGGTYPSGPQALQCISANLPGGIPFSNPFRREEIGVTVNEGAQVGVCDYIPPDSLYTEVPYIIICYGKEPDRGALLTLAGGD